VSWTPLRFARSPGTNWTWFVAATDGFQERQFSISEFRLLLADGRANRGPEPPYITDETLDRLERERLTPEELAQRESAREIQEQITARDQALADAQARKIQSWNWRDVLPDWAGRPVLGVPGGVWLIAAGVMLIAFSRPARR
jgi:hypothetical protein